MTDTPPEHARHERYLRDLSQASESTELDLIRTVLADPDQVMAVSAVLTHIDRCAGGLDEAQFEAWSAPVTALAGHHDPLLRRIRDWTRLKAMDAGRPVDTADLATAGDWLQRAAAETTTSLEALAVLAAHGRTRRVRNAAQVRAKRLGGV
ncbi:hypothetical protein GCM10009839_09820 [Catenulispora yoronensis]|uniref:DUF222 domain-containing protein n=1 Tax=Catenulispora yoronensis TaxID=450799 RepID=A0ABN2TPG7_9ACTN